MERSGWSNGQGSSDFMHMICKYFRSSTVPCTGLAVWVVALVLWGVSWNRVLAQAPLRRAVVDGPAFAPPALQPFAGPPAGGSPLGLPPTDALTADSAPAAYDPLCGPQLPEYKDGLFQLLFGSATWIDETRAGGLDLVELDAYLGLAVPMPTTDWPLVIGTSLYVTLLDGPQTLELPDEIYEATVDLMWLPKLTDRLTAIAAVKAGMYSDFESTDGALRLSGKGLLRWQPRGERLQLVAGVLYLNREDVRLLPAGGIIWRPTDRLTCDLVFPQPKIAYRSMWGDRFVDQLYLAGEFGGNSYRYSRANGVRDTLTLRDLRLLLGYERLFGAGAKCFAEVGYVFGRQIEFTSVPGEIDFDPSLLLRAGLSY